jgi:hypothetical protein
MEALAGGAEQDFLTRMRLAFFCGSLEPGRDGVGDYSRRLAGEFVRQGNPCVLVGINDGSLSEMHGTSQEIERTRIPVLRLPTQMPWNERVMKAREWVGAFKPDWASFQFVPFAYHRKGLCFGLGKYLAQMNPGVSWQIMMHELWLGLGKKSPLKDRVYGVLQRRILMDVIGRLHPRVLHTQTEPYRRVLQREKINVHLLPLFSNIPRVNADGWEGLLEPLVTKATGRRDDRSGLYLVGILGGVHPEWNVKQAVNALLPLVQRSQKRLVLVFLGKNNLPLEAFNRIRLMLRNRAYVAVAGERSDLEISKILQALDFGVATSPRQLIQKSGSVAAMLEHGLSLLVTRDDWRLRESSPPADEVFSRLLTPQQFAALETLPMRDPDPPEGNSVRRVAERMLASMNGTVAANGAKVLCAS